MKVNRGTTFRAPIEYFLLLQEKPNQDRLVYYDHEGHRLEAEVSRAAIDAAFSLFNGKPKGVHRSTGGIALAEPTQLVIYDYPSNLTDLPPQIKVKVEFKDFRRDQGGPMSKLEYVTHTKIVAPKDLVEGVEFNSHSPQKFALDFGKGLVPVHVIQFEAGPHGKVYAYFIELETLSRLRSARPGTPILTPIYHVLRDVLRIAGDKRGPRNEKSEHEWAIQNYLHLKKQNERIIPSALKSGPPQLAIADNDTRLTLQILIKERNLRQYITTEAKSHRPAPTVVISDMMPFGIFEDR